MRIPSDRPLVILGENNAGKSNIVGALDLILGETYPGNHEPDDHEYHGRDTDGDPISISVELQDVVHAGKYGNKPVVSMTWECPPQRFDDAKLFMTHGVGDDSSYVSNNTRGQCLCIMVGADRRSGYQFSYASKWTLLSKLMRQFHRALRSETAIVKELEEHFQAIEGAFGRVPAFRAFADDLTTQVDEMSRNLRYGLSIDFSAYDPSNYFHALRVIPEEGGEPRSFDELGTGQEQVFAIAFTHAYAKAFHGTGRNLILVVEEPEAHLHPLAQEWMAAKLYDLAAVDGVQVIITTHSPAFIRMSNLENLALVIKPGSSTKVKQLTTPQLVAHCAAQGGKGTEQTILPFYEAASTAELLEGFFARRIVLVEGPTEKLGLSVLLKRAGLDPTAEGVAILSVGGVGNLARWRRLFSAYEIPTFTVFDRDGEYDQTRADDLCAALQLDATGITELTGGTPYAVTPKAASFEHDFEATLRALAPTYSALEQRARDDFGLAAGMSKPLVARFACTNVPLDGDLLALVQELVASIRTA